VQTCRVADNSLSATAERVRVDVIRPPRHKAQMSCVSVKQGLGTTGLGFPSCDKVQQHTNSPDSCIRVTGLQLSGDMQVSGKARQTGRPSV